jgi:hypothetical protein
LIHISLRVVFFFFLLEDFFGAAGGLVLLNPAPGLNLGTLVLFFLIAMSKA